MVGPTLATIPFRVRINSAASVRASSEDVLSRTINMIPYEGTGLHNIRKLGPDANKACQFRNLLVIQQQHGFYYPKLLREVYRFTENIAAIDTYPLTLLCDLNGNHIMIYISYDPQLLSEARVRLLTRHLGGAILQLLENPSSNVGDIELDGQDARQQLQTWNHKASTKIGSTAHELIYYQFQSQPQATAVCAWDGDLSYHELNHLSAQLAKTLVPVAILAVIRAGGAFVLMDTTYPLDRLKSIGHQLNAPVLLTSTALLPAASSLDLPTICVDTYAWQEPISHGQIVTETWGWSAVAPHNKLYAVFTSGTTGSPKGVVIEHGAFVSSAFAAKDHQGIEKHGRVLQASSYAFDVSVFDHLSTLLVGGCLCIPRASHIQDDLAGAINEFQANYIRITPSLAEAHAVKLVNSYGPAKYSVTCSIQGTVKPDSSPLNIGFATGSTGWIVNKDDHHRLAPIGTVGELLVEGPILGRGYLHDEEQTSVPFIPDPAWMRRFPVSGAISRRLYKTGDLVQMQPEDGSLLYIGRKDTQVKIHGQRIELGEVEHHLKNHFPDAVRVVAAVVVSEDEGSVPVLVAFIEINTDQEQFVGQVSKHSLFLLPTAAFRTKTRDVLSQLRRKLTTVMVPAVFIPTTRIPLSTAGKIERRKLQQVASRLKRTEIRSYVAVSRTRRDPVTAAERLALSICCRVLRLAIEDIGMDDTFFELGGNSILAIYFVREAREAGWDVQVVNIFN
ncbi:hypothetical protein F5X98DRAFT_385116 [Xylaria grammica]|nr:hypothetical protein F5X98DRAFT_385116 [Xylaria grammica]